MNYPPDPSEQVILKTAQAALRGYAAAFTSRFQSQQAASASAGTTSAPPQSPARKTGFLQLCSPRGDSTVSHTRAVTASPPADCVQETIRLNSRPHQTLIRHACRNSSVLDARLRFMGTACPEISDLRGRKLADTPMTGSFSLRGKSVSSVTAEEYCIRRVTRQRVFHEKGNAD
ncbi:hypothetical protein Pan153_04950 [Gimesia panareensis]|uniref:Uncharacterized protein n=1 Tax=Gimesia panareensis TaxID=2527978 RepID=A0A518FHQ0_9PLAN|nr:hypothetical protein Pan153_04950 [Gimesia panareensis]